MKHFILENFNIPEGFKTEKLTLRMLTIKDVDLDYEAVIGSLNYLQKIRPLGPDYNWPPNNLTLEQNLIDLGWHQKEFQRKTSFAYTVMNPEQNKCLGCLYIFPSSNSEYDAMVMMWVRESELENGLDEYLFEKAKDWIKKEWLFKKPGYPGREIDWEKWNALK